MIAQVFKWLKKLAVVVAVGSLAACASGARPGAMTAALDTAHVIDEKSPLYMAVSVKPIEGGKETSPLWKSNVANEDFKAALEQSLQLNTMLATTRAKYDITVKLEELDQPFAGFDMTVTATVHYIVAPIGGGTPVLDKTFKTPYTAKFGDALAGAERLRLANEGAVKENITQFIAALATANITAPTS